ncbi:hypothetical protein GCM10020256_55550 [Streptomyces thermocoprophilus]
MPCTYVWKNWSTAGSLAPVTVRWCPHADSTIGASCFSYGLISVYGVFFTLAASASTSAFAALSVYVTQTAPCSSECTAFSFFTGFVYTVPLQSAQTGLWSPPTGGCIG